MSEGEARRATRPPRGVELWAMLWRATRRIEAAARRSVEATGLCLSDFGVLEALLHEGPLPASALGRRVLISSGSMTAAVDRLEALGLVERRSAPSDRRARIAHLTPNGRAQIRRLFAQHARDMERAFAGLDDAERRALSALLERLTAPAPGDDGPG